MRDRMVVVGEAVISLSPLEVRGRVLDVCGGGEGIIGLLMGDQVVAIDLKREELEESAAGPLKIIMDARELGFLDGTFAAATSFFGLMYIGDEDLQRVCREVHRVLRPGGEFHIWDCAIPEEAPEGKDIALVKLQVLIGDQTVDTGYGSRWPGRPRNADSYSELLREVGFEVVRAHEDGSVLTLRARKSAE
jgi:ubiquinone/menaquinone biosynthesis C-methylase UbiE